MRSEQQFMRNAVIDAFKKIDDWYWRYLEKKRLSKRTNACPVCLEDNRANAAKCYKRGGMPEKE